MNRLRILFALLVCIMTFQFVNAQASIGLRAGVLISKQTFKNGNLDVNPESKFGLDLALITEFPLNPTVAIAPEFHWLQKGNKIEDLGGGIEESAQTFNYLEIPVLLKLTFGEEPGIFVFGGPSFGYLFTATDKDGDGNNNDIDLEDFNRTEIGAHVGAGLELGPVLIDVRYIAGFTNIANFEADDLEIRNSGFGAGIGFKF
jgi:hypothetical protein